MLGNSVSRLTPMDTRLTPMDISGKTFAGLSVTARLNESKVESFVYQNRV